MAEITNGDVVPALQALKELGSVKMPSATALKIVKLHKALASHLEDVNKVHTQLLDEHAEKGDDGSIKLTEDKQNAVLKKGEETEFAEAVTALMRQTFEVPANLVLTAGEFGTAEVAPFTLGALGELVTF